MKMYFILTLLILCFLSAFSQEKDRFINDKKLDKEIRALLIKHIDSYNEDSLGKKTIDTDSYIDRLITTRNFKTDSILTNQRLVGVYSCKYAGLGDRPWLYIQYPDRIEFLELNEKMNLKKTLSRLIKFMNAYPKDFSLSEKMYTIENVMKEARYNIYHKSFEL